MLGLKEVIKDFQETTKRGMIYHAALNKKIRDEIVPFLRKCRRLYAGTEISLKYIRDQISKQGQQTKTLDELKVNMIEAIDEYITNRVIMAQEVLITYGLSILSDKKEEVILTFGNQESYSVEEILKAAHKAGKKIRVIVVDSSPEFHGRSVVKRLSNHGI